MPNPTLAKLYEDVEIARKHKADFILAVGGSSVCDYAKAVSVSVNCSEEPWEKYYLCFEEPYCRLIPVGCILTMVGTGSEMNAGAVITNQDTRQKNGQVFANEAVMPKFSILNPKFTLTLYKEDDFSGELHSSEEGEVKWIKKDGFIHEKLAQGMETVFNIINCESISECFYNKETQEEIIR